MTKPAPGGADPPPRGFQVKKKPGASEAIIVHFPAGGLSSNVRPPKEVPSVGMNLISFIVIDPLALPTKDVYFHLESHSSET